MNKAVKASSLLTAKATGVLPKLERIDLVFSYTNFLRRLFRSTRETIYRHKLKSIVVILGLYGAHKTFGVYKSLKSALNPLSDLQQLDNDDQAAPAHQPSQEANQLKAYLERDAMHLLQVKVFQSSQRNVLDNLPK